MGTASARPGPPRRLEDVCHVARHQKPLGRGAFGTVWFGYLVRGVTPVAIKELETQKMLEMKVPVNFILREVELMHECLGNDRFVQLIDFIEARGIFFIVLEFCDGGNLEDAALVGEGQLRERQAARLLRQLLEAIHFLHSRHIVHRDIKPQNIMIMGVATDRDVRVKLGDFGIATRQQPGTLLREKVGTPAFMAPELHLLPDKCDVISPRSTTSFACVGSPVARLGYDSKVDLWAAGVVMVFVLSLEYPFVDDSGRLLRDRLLRGDLPLWDLDAFSGLFQRVQEAAGMRRRRRPSQAGQNLIRLLLFPRHAERPCARLALQHSWFLPTTNLEDRGDDMPLLRWSDFKEQLLALDGKILRAAHSVPCVVGNADQLTGVSASPLELPVAVGPPALADVVASLKADGSPWRTRIRSEEELRRTQVYRNNLCCVCGLVPLPTAATSLHVCPVCEASVCHACARRELSLDPRCPKCGDIQRNAADLVAFIAAGDAWSEAGAHHWPWHRLWGQLMTLCTCNAVVFNQPALGVAEIAIVDAR